MTAPLASAHCGCRICRKILQCRDSACAEPQGITQASPATLVLVEPPKMPHEDNLDTWTGLLGPKLLEDDLEEGAVSLQALLDVISRITQVIDVHPYCVPLYILLARYYRSLGYPDLGAGAAYKALLLSDAVQDESDEYHEEATESLAAVMVALPQTDLAPPFTQITHAQHQSDNDDCPSDAAQMVTAVYLPLIYMALIDCLTSCGCYKTANSYCIQARSRYPHHDRLLGTVDNLHTHVAKYFRTGSNGHGSSNLPDPSDWPDQGAVRRERYPWNNMEPDRFQELPEINVMMSKVAPKLEVLAVELPALTGTPMEPGVSKTSKQLGVFAKEDLKPGEYVLNETSLLTANNKLQDALCDACSADLPGIGSPEFDLSVSCAECEVVFCSQHCHDNAQEMYHPALCDKDVESIARDVPAAEAADSLYSLLLLRALAMANTQQCHPLELSEIKYIWADFHGLPLDENWKSIPEDRSAFCAFPQTLPFSFEHNIRLPFHMLEKMDIDIFQNPQYDVWVFNTLYAKFRGTASARLSGLGGRAIRGPEVSAVHPMWCMANHSCDPNVSWEWGGSIKFWVREARPEWRRGGGETMRRDYPGIRKGEEVFNHYCDVDLGVRDRREWARGALGGDCRCPRCLWEATDK